MLSFSNTYREYLWTKYDLAARIGVENRMTYMGTTQLAAGCFSLKPTSSNIDLLNEWISISCEDNYRYLDETESKLQNHKQFIEHRHDASISSLLRKKRGTTVTHYEVQKYDNEFEKSKLSFPFYAHRLTK